MIKRWMLDLNDTIMEQQPFFILDQRAFYTLYLEQSLAHFVTQRCFLMMDS